MPRKLRVFLIFISLLGIIIGWNYLFKNLLLFHSNPVISSTKTSNIDGMNMVYVPAGEFMMGADVDDALAECQKYRSDCQRSWFTDEGPSHKVELDAFWMDQTEVTNAMYAHCVADGFCLPPSSIKSRTHDSYYGNPEFDDYPVIYVNWYQANAYCTWAGRELPTEAQWEKTARGTDGRTYPWGDDSPNSNLLNYNWNIGDTVEVGSYLDGASIYDALDMSGNVWELVSSLYQDYPYNEKDGREDLTTSGARGLRGGSWVYDNDHVRSANRTGIDPSQAYDFLGFRCSLSHP